MILWNSRYLREFHIDNTATLKLELSDIEAGTYYLYLTLYLSEEATLISNLFTLTVYDPNQIEEPEEIPPLLPSEETPPEETTPEQTTVRLVIDEVVYTINGVSAQAEVAPFIDTTYSRTMVPLSTVALALGAHVEWNEGTRTATISNNEQVLLLQVDTSLPGGMGIPMIVGDRTFVPVAYIAQFFGADTRWDSVSRAVYISRQS